MKRLLLVAIVLVGVGAAVAQDKPAAASTAQAMPTPPVPSATPSDVFTGWIDVGYRWIPTTNGNFNTYRGIVNLGQGPKLFGADIAFRPEKNRLFDRMEIQASSWGGEPNNSARIDIHKAGVYDFNANYRRLDYFNDLITLANPLIALGSIHSQTARDTERRLFDAQLDLFPKSRFSPFIAFSRDSGDGPGLQNFVFTAPNPSDEFGSRALFDDSQNMVRGGVHLNTERLRMTLEGGGVNFQDTESVFYQGAANPGNVRAPIFGVNQFLTQSSQVTHSTGSSFFSQASVLWRLFESLDVSGQFTFSQPSVNTSFAESATGQFLRVDQLLAFTGQTGSSRSAALRPHPAGNLAFDWRIGSRVRIVQSWYTDRFHVDASSLFLQTLTGVSDPFTPGSTRANVSFSNPDFQMLATQYNRYQGEAIVELFPRLTLRAGYRAEWADAALSPSNLNLAGTDPAEGTQRHKAVLSGLEFKPLKTLSLSAEGEAKVGTSEDFFRVGLPELNKFKLRARYKPRPWMNLSLTHSWLEGSNDTPGVNSEFHVRQTSANLMLAPGGGKRVNFSLDYMNSATDSNILALVNPALFQTGNSNYFMNSHSAGAWCDVHLLRGARLDFGGSMLLSSGTRPTNFYQPRVLLSAPITARTLWTAEWRYYGFREELYPAENFNSQQFSLGMRLKLR